MVSDDCPLLFLFLLHSNVLQNRLSIFFVVFFFFHCGRCNFFWQSLVLHSTWPYHVSRRGFVNFTIYSSCSVSFISLFVFILQGSPSFAGPHFSVQTFLALLLDIGHLANKTETQQMQWVHSVTLLYQLFIYLTQHPPVGQGVLIHEVSRSHSTTHHSR